VRLAGVAVILAVVAAACGNEGVAESEALRAELSDDTVAWLGTELCDVGGTLPVTLEEVYWPSPERTDGWGAPFRYDRVGDDGHRIQFRSRRNPRDGRRPALAGAGRLHALTARSAPAG
jgi:hypothetical protein